MKIPQEGPDEDLPIITVVPGLLMVVLETMLAPMVAGVLVVTVLLRKKGKQKKRTVLSSSDIRRKGTVLRRTKKRCG